MENRGEARVEKCTRVYNNNANESSLYAFAARGYHSFVLLLSYIFFFVRCSFRILFKIEETLNGSNFNIRNSTGARLRFNSDEMVIGMYANQKFTVPCRKENILYYNA